MLQRVRNSRGKPQNTRAAYIAFCPIAATKPPSGPGWGPQ